MAIFSGYVGAVKCTQGPTTGARGLMSWFLAKYADDGGLNAGIYNCRSIRGGSTTSLHGEGRAADLAIRPYRASYGTELANLLRLYSKELGIQCVIWNRKIWSGKYHNWRTYTGVNPHVDHLHVELSWAAANRSEADMVDLLEKTLGHLVDGPLPENPKPPTAPKEIWQNTKNSKEDNIAIAMLLNSLGYNAGNPDGVPGPYLYNGVLAYQKAQLYFPNMNRDGDWYELTQEHFNWVRDELQRNCNLWLAGGRKKLRLDGDYAKMTGDYVRAMQLANAKRYRTNKSIRFDRIAGPVFCKAFDIKKHPRA